MAVAVRIFWVKWFLWPANSSLFKPQLMASMLGVALSQKCRERERQTDGQIDRQMDRQSGKQEAAFADENLKYSTTRPERFFQLDKTNRKLRMESLL